ncbi:hypothetical protein IEQ34_025271 [Dendrobium chrysotoxum]|uniref:Uncharacterized protein n=1 Tax=Dendrobium chrysotoxum TaxID=161865 RepID=A0AAV7FQD2_DENCH|nr:hypothetical protein IEQ34_025271 [Dendrobium chrysotoxum]
MPTINRIPKRATLWAILGVIVIFTIFLAIPYRHNLQDTFSYSTRPLWDKSELPKDVIAHLHSPTVPSNDSAACARHGWKPRLKPVNIWDATLISTELDMLEIRMRELWDVVDSFLVMESTHTMTGIEKSQMHFQQNSDRFLPFFNKLHHKVVQGRAMRKGDGPFTLANEQRAMMTAFINQLSPSSDTLILMADIDEIPNRATIELIKACETPLPLHLQLQNYLYSFEFATLADSWRASIQRWSDARGYTHGKVSEQILTASGWHCSFCFGTLADFKYKMLSASHVDRLLKRPAYKSYLTDASIQNRICSGKDLYDMPPEVFSWGDLIQYWNGANIH